MRLDYSVNINGGHFERVEDALSAAGNGIIHIESRASYLENRINELENQLNNARELINRHHIFKEKLLIAIENNRPYQDFLKILNEI